MKKMMFSFVVLTISVCGPLGYAQSKYRSALQKGSVLTALELATSFGTNKESYRISGNTDSFKSDYSSFTLGSTTGLFLANGFMLGIVMDVTATTTKFDQPGYSSKYTSSQYTFGPVARVFMPGGFFFHGDVGFGKNTIKSSSDYGGNTDSNRVTVITVGMGYAIFLNDFIALEPTLMYKISKSKDSEDGAVIETRLGEFVMGAGLSIYLHKRFSE
jgi:hypothetical protein